MCGVVAKITTEPLSSLRRFEIIEEISVRIAA